MTCDTWLALGHVPSTELVEARLTLHYAAQPLAAAAYAALPMREDHSHTNFLWSAERRGFLGRELADGQRLFLDPTSLRIVLLDAEGQERGGIQQEGRSLEQSFAELPGWLPSLEEGRDTLQLPSYDLPASPLAEGAAFAVDRAGLSELASWFHDADRVLSRVSEALLQGAEVRGWPHHFDLAALLTLDPELDPEQARSVGVGFSPGDGSYAEPYFYVSPWPYPDPTHLPALARGGHWHTQGFTAAVLPGHVLVAAGAADEQEQVAQEFLSGAVRACLRLGGETAGG